MSAIATLPSLAQVTPDATLGTEASVVAPGVQIRGDIADLIEGGAIRGGNLFHSFLEFNVDPGQRVYFANPAGIESILSRITGGDPSNIFGTLGVDGGADLFLLNPNGIVFGPSASLDVEGSFVGTTADAVQFGDQGFFAATDPALPAILTVDSSALWFNQIAPNGITNNSIAPIGSSSSGIDLFGLRASTDRSFLLVGGDINMAGGRIIGSGSRIELGGLAEPGVVNLETDGNFIRLAFPEDTLRSNISLTDDGLVGLIGREGGDIAAYADTLIATNGGRLVAVIEGAEDSSNITVEASQIDLSGVGLSLLTSGFFSLALPDATGNAGDITVTTNSIAIRSGAQVSSTTSGLGNAGDINVKATESIQIIGSTVLANGQAVDSGLRSQTQGSGEAGDIALETRELIVQDGGAISASTFGAGEGGNITISANTIEVSGISENSPFSSGIGSTSDINQLTQQSATGDAGDVTIATQSLSLREGGAILTLTSGIGEAGDIRITADSVEVTGVSKNGQLLSRIISDSTSNLSSEESSPGAAGNISVLTRLLSIQNGAQISTSTFEGEGGNLNIIATESIRLRGSADLDNSRVSNSGLVAQTQGSGTAGNIELKTRELVVQDGGIISASTFGFGEGGDVTISASIIEVIGVSENNPFSSGIGSTSDINQFTRQSATADAGDVTIATQSLSLREGGAILTSTSGSGEAGNVKITADSVEVTGVSSNGQLFSRIISNSAGNRFTGELASGIAGDVTVLTRLLSVRDGGRISTETAGGGTGGNLSIAATELTELIGSGSIGLRFDDTGAPIMGETSSGLTTQTTGTANAGRLRLETGQLSIREGAGISASTFGAGTAGGIEVVADSIDVAGVRKDQLFVSSIQSISGLTLDLSPALGESGDVTVSTRLLSVRDGGRITTETFGGGDSGNLSIKVVESTELIGSGSIILDFDDMGAPIFGETSSGLTTQTTGAADAGRLRLETGQLSIRSGATINASTFSAGAAGDVEVIADSISLTGVREDQLFSSSIQSISGQVPGQLPATGKAGNVEVTGQRLNIEDGGFIATVTIGEALAGNITVNIQDRLEMTNGNISTTAFQASGGDIQINTAEGFDSGEIVLRGDSDITTSSRRNGGNIIIRGSAIVAFDDSDILTTSEDETGGDIILDNFFSERDPFNGSPPLDGNNRVDVNAEGRIASGNISTPDVSFVENDLTNLEDNLIGITLTAGSCIARTDESLGSFTTTGSGGLPQRPGDSNISVYPTGTVRAAAEPAATIQEPDGVYQLPNGRLVLSRACE